VYYVPIGKVRCARYPQYVPDHFGNLTNWFLAHSLLNIYLLTYLFPKFHETPPITFWVILLTDRQTNGGQNSTSPHVAEGNKRRLQTAGLLDIYFKFRMNLRDSFGLLVK